MKSDPQPKDETPKDKPAKKWSFKRVVLGMVGVLVLLWLASIVLNQFERAAPTQGTGTDAALHQEQAPPAAPAESAHAVAPSPAAPQATEGHGVSPAETPQEDQLAEAFKNRLRTPAATHAPAAAEPAPAPVQAHTPPAAAPMEVEGHAATPEGHALPATPGVNGEAFVGALITVMNHELNERAYGWRPNDIVDFTDNVNNMQLGVLEVARRTAEVLVERISRTGTTQSFDKDLEKARNNFMINADQYWMPSAEASYQDAIEALQRYQHKLRSGTAFFYSRTDNLIPLLQAYENLLGSCDDNLIKMKESDGSDVSWFRADDYFFYAQGVAGAMYAILEAVAADFANTLEPRRGTDVLHHALQALHHAMEIHPTIILDGDPSGFLANHRANLAGAISHSRFYIGLLIQALST